LPSGLPLSEYFDTRGSHVEKLDRLFCNYRAYTDAMQRETNAKESVLSDSTIGLELELLDVKEAATFCRSAVSTVYRDVERGDMPHIKKGHRLLFRREDLRVWLLGMRRNVAEERS
jgi:excisionase family DNA binding protein